MAVSPWALSPVVKRSIARGRAGPWLRRWALEGSICASRLGARSCARVGIRVSSWMRKVYSCAHGGALTNVRPADNPGLCWWRVFIHVWGKAGWPGRPGGRAGFRSVRTTRLGLSLRAQVVRGWYVVLHVVPIGQRLVYPARPRCLEPGGGGPGLFPPVEGRGRRSSGEGSSCSHRCQSGLSPRAWERGCGGRGVNPSYLPRARERVKFRHPTQVLWGFIPARVRGEGSSPQDLRPVMSAYPRVREGGHPRASGFVPAHARIPRAGRRWETTPTFVGSTGLFARVAEGGEAWHQTRRSWIYLRACRGKVLVLDNCR